MEGAELVGWWAIRGSSGREDVLFGAEGGDEKGMDDIFRRSSQGERGGRGGGGVHQFPFRPEGC